MWCENCGGAGCGGGYDDSTDDDNDEVDDNDNNIFIIVCNTNLEYDSILQASVHKSSMSAHELLNSFES
jgi:hypothetical protein